MAAQPSWPIRSLVNLLRVCFLTVQVINEHVKERWPQDQSQGYTTSGWLLNVVLLISSVSAWQFSQFSLHRAVHLSGPYLVSLPMGMS